MRWELKRGSLQGPKLTHGRTSDRSSPFKEEPLPVGSLYIADLGYLDWGSIAARRAAGSYTLTRAQSRTMYWTVEGRPLKLDSLLLQQVGQTKELWVRVGETNQQVFYVLSLCFVGFLFLVVVHQVFLHILLVFRCCYMYCYMLFHCCACCLVATWSCLGVAK